MSTENQRNPREYITALDVSELLNISLSTIYILCKGEKIPHYQIGSQKRFKKNEINQWIDTRHKAQREDLK